MNETIFPKKPLFGIGKKKARALKTIAPLWELDALRGMYRVGMGTPPYLCHVREKNRVSGTPPTPASNRRDHRRPRLARHVRQLDLIAIRLVVILPPGFPSRNRGGVPKGGGREDVEIMKVYSTVYTRSITYANGTAKLQ